jgi:hypothetical protein
VPSRSQQRRLWSSLLRCCRRPNQATAASTWPPPYSGCHPPPPQLRQPLPPRPRLPRHQRAIICMWYSPVFYSSHSIHAITTLQLQGGCQFIEFYLRLILQSHRLWCSRCHICQDIFGRIDIIYCTLPYVFRGVLPLKTLVLYIYRPRGTIQYNQQSYTIYSSYINIFLGDNSTSCPLGELSSLGMTTDRVRVG